MTLVESLRSIYLKECCMVHVHERSRLLDDVAVMIPLVIRSVRSLTIKRC